MTILRISLMEFVLWLWLYLYFALVEQWATLVSVPQDWRAANSMLAKMTTAFRLA
jgi:hypothetical protein